MREEYSWGIRVCNGTGENTGIISRIQNRSQLCVRSEGGMVMENLRTVALGRFGEWVTLVFYLVGFGRYITW